MREITPDDVKQFCDEQQTVEGLKYNLNHMGRLFLQSEEVVVEERSKNAALEARHEFALNANKELAAKIKTVEAANTRLDDQVGRQSKTIDELDGIVDHYRHTTVVLNTEKDVALANAAARIKYLQGELVRVSALAKAKATCCYADLFRAVNG
jgi:hypothetical protein